MFGIFVDLDFLHAIAGEELGEGEVRAEQQQKVGLMNGVIGSAVTEQAGHADGVGIVMFQPLLAAERIADRRLQSVRQLEHLLAGIPAPIAAEDRHRLRIVDHLRELIEVRVGRAEDGRGRELLISGDWSAASADATSPGMEITVGPFSVTAVRIAVCNDRPRLLGIDEAPGVEGCGFEELVGIEFFERRCVDELRLHIAGNGDDRSPLLARVHEPIEQMDDAGAGRSTHRNGIAGQAGLGDGGKNAVLFVADVDELDLAVAAQRRR